MTLPVELQQLPPFDQLSAQAQALLARGMVRKRAARGAPLLHLGEPISGAYVVLQGQLRVFHIAPQGTEATLYFIAPGETCVLALNCLFNNLLYPAWVQAETDVEVALIPGPLYRTLFEREAPIRNLTVQTLSTLVFRLMAELGEVHASGQSERLAHFILQHADSDGCLRMTQQQLARHLGTSREVVARLLRDLVGRELLRPARGQIQVVDLPGLRRAAVPDPAKPRSRSERGPA